MSNPVIKAGDRIVIYTPSYPPYPEDGREGTYVRWHWKDVEEVMYDDGTTQCWANENIRLLGHTYPEWVTKFKAGDLVRTLIAHPDTKNKIGDIARIHYVARYHSTDIPNYLLIFDGEGTFRHGGWSDEHLELVE